MRTIYINFENTTFKRTKYEGYYASKCGCVISTKRKHLYILKGKIDKDGYIQYTLSVNGKQVYKRGHRVIAETYIPNLDKKPQINHKNGIKNDNKISNLEWVTSSENNYHRFQELGNKADNEIRYNLLKQGKIEGVYNVSELSSMVSHRYITSVASNSPQYCHMNFIKKDKAISVYWNGKIINTFNTNIEASLFFKKAKNTISAKINNEKTKSEIFSKEYTIVKQCSVETIENTLS